MGIGMSNFTFIDMTGQVLPTGVRVIQRVSRRPLRWLCICEKCGSERVFDHSKVMAAIQGAKGNVAQCDLSNCRLFGTATKPTPPTARPNHEPEIVAPPTSPTPVPRPARLVVAAPKVSDEYQRYVREMRRWGHPDSSIGTWRDFQMLNDTQKARIMAPVIRAEKDREIEALAASLEASERQRLKEQYGI
jgi:uncharacterized short protein YbdD (DUF466 family)